MHQKLLTKDSELNDKRQPSGVWIGEGGACLEKNRDQNRINLLIQVFSGLYSLFLTISPLIFP
jgi:hypothetical protein